MKGPFSCLVSLWIMKSEILTGASHVAQTVKDLPAMQETRVRSLGWQDPLEKETAAHSSVPAWSILWTEEPGGLPSTDGTEPDTTEWLTLSLLRDLQAHCKSEKCLSTVRAPSRDSGKRTWECPVHTPWPPPAAGLPSHQQPPPANADLAAGTRDSWGCSSHGAHGPERHPEPPPEAHSVRTSMAPTTPACKAQGSPQQHANPNVGEHACGGCLSFVPSRPRWS